MKRVDYHSNPDWFYSGDVNATYGGMWIRHYGDYCDAIEVIDLEGSRGFTGAVSIERKSAGLPRKLSKAKAHIKDALSSCGQTIVMLAGMSAAQRHAYIWEAMLLYGYGDGSTTLETLQLESDGPLAFNGCQADRRQTCGDIGGYVMAKYLD